MRIADGPVVLVSSPICHQVAVSGSHMRSAVRRNSPLHRQGSVFGPRVCSSRAPHSPICRQRGVLSGPREGEPLISTRLSAHKVTHPDEGGAHRRPRTPQADRPPHPTRSWAAAPGPPHCPPHCAGMGVAAGPLQAISRDAGARNASIPKRRSSLAPFRSPSGFHSRMAVGRPLSCRQHNRRTQSKADPSLHLVSPCGTDLTLPPPPPPPTNPPQ